MPYFTTMENPSKWPTPSPIKRDVFFHCRSTNFATAYAMCCRL
jgi:hypothetical protein